MMLMKSIHCIIKTLALCRPADSKEIDYYKRSITIYYHKNEINLLLKQLITDLVIQGNMRHSIFKCNVLESIGAKIL